MNEELDPKLLALFADAQQRLEAHDFLGALLARLEAQRRRRLRQSVFGGLIALGIIAWIAPAVLAGTAGAFAFLDRLSLPMPSDSLMLSPWGWGVSMLLALLVLLRFTPRRR